MYIGPALPPDPQTPELVQPGIAAFHHPPHGAQPGAMSRASAGHYRRDPQTSQRPVVFGTVVGAVGEHRVRTAAGTPPPTADRWDRVHQRQKPGDIADVTAGQEHRQGDTTTVGDHMVLGTRPAAVDRARPGLGPPFNALTCVESTTARDQSIRLASRRSANITS